MPTPQRPRTTRRPARRLRARLVWRPNTPAAAQRPEGFTLVELIVAIVLIGLLAALAVPAFRAVTGRVHDRVALAEMAAVSRHAAALVSLDDATSVGFSEEALAASLAGAPEALAGEVVYRTERTAAGFALLEENTSSEAYGDVSWNIADDGSAIGLAMRSRSGRCAWVTGDRTGAVQEGVTDAPEGQCIRLADGSEGGGTDGDGPGPAIPDPEEFPYDDIPDDLVTPWPNDDTWKVPDEDDERVGDPIDAPAPGNHDPDEVTATFHALTSFVHPSWPAPHRMLVTQPSSGRVVMVRQNSNTTPGNASATVFATGLPGASGIVVGPDPSTPAGGGVLVLYPVYVGTSANGGSIVRIQPETRTKTTVATNLGGTPTSLATGARCLTASGSFTSGWCIYATVGDTVKTVNVNNGAVTTIHTATTELRAVQPIAGPALAVTTAAGTHTVSTSQLSGTTPTSLPAATSTAAGGLTWQGNHPSGTQGSLVGLWGTNASGLVGPGGATVSLPAATDVHAHGNLDTLYATAGSCVIRVSWRNDGVSAPGGVRATPSVAPLWCAGGIIPPADSGTLTFATFVGSGTSSTVDGTGTGAALASPSAAVWHQGALYVGTDGGWVRRVSSGGQVTTINSSPITSSVFTVTALTSVDGSLYALATSGANGRVVALDPVSGEHTLIASPSYASGLVAAPDGMLYTSYTWGSTRQVRRIDPTTGTTTVTASLPASVRGVGTDATHLYAATASGLYRAAYSNLGAWAQVATVDTSTDALLVTTNHVYMAEGSHALVRVAKSGGTVTRVAGVASSGYRDGTGPNAWFNHIAGIASDGTRLYVTDRGNHRVRAANLTPVPSGQIPAPPTVGFAPGTASTHAGSLASPSAAVWHQGALYVGTDGGWVRRVSSGGQVTTINSSPITSSVFTVTALTSVDGSLYALATSGANGRVVALDPVSGEHTLIASPSYASGLVAAPDGMLYTSYSYGSTRQVRRIDPTTGTTTVTASLPAAVRGIGTDATHLYAATASGLYRAAYSNLGAWTQVATVSSTTDGLLVTANHVYLAEGSHALVRVAKTGGAPALVVGDTASGYVDASGEDARFNHIAGIASDGTRLYVTDRGNHRVRRVAG